VHVPPVLSIMGVLIIGDVLGPLGLIVALPTLVMFLVITRRILITRIYEGHGFRKTVRDSAFIVRAPVPDGAFLLTDGVAADVLAIAEERQQRVA
jgi:hypothetical protein